MVRLFFSINWLIDCFSLGCFWSKSLMNLLACFCRGCMLAGSSIMDKAWATKDHPLLTVVHNSQSNVHQVPKKLRNRRLLLSLTTCLRRKQRHRCLRPLRRFRRVSRKIVSAEFVRLDRVTRLIPRRRSLLLPPLLGSTDNRLSVVSALRIKLINPPVGCCRHSIPRLVFLPIRPAEMVWWIWRLRTPKGRRLVSPITILKINVRFRSDLCAWLVDWQNQFWCHRSIHWLIHWLTDWLIA